MLDRCVYPVQRALIQTGDALIDRKNPINFLRILLHAQVYKLQPCWYGRLILVIHTSVTKSYCRIAIDLHMTVAQVASLLPAVHTQQ